LPATRTAAAFSFAAASLFGNPLSAGGLYTIKAILIPAFLMLFFGVLDDWHELSISTKFLAQFVATSLLFVLGVKTQIVCLGVAGNLIVTFLWVLGVTNAFNHLDVIDGLAAGTALTASLAFFLLAYLNADIQSIVVSLALAAATLAFFLYNFPPARIYMGNSGSHFLGFLLAAVALSISYAPLGREAALFSPLFILGLPILDTAFLIVVRLMKKNIPFKKSNDHPALRLLFLGYSKKKALLFMLFLSLFFCLCGVIITRLPNYLSLSLVSVAVIAALAVSCRMAKINID
jgi:UDP-GlcNAc:undecaprenyl-phosphate GlcNAc-1-phosphate transferase